MHKIHTHTYTHTYTGITHTHTHTHTPQYVSDTHPPINVIKYAIAVKYANTEIALSSENFNTSTIYTVNMPRRP